MPAQSLTNYTYGVNVVAVIVCVCLLVWILLRSHDDSGGNSAISRRRIRSRVMAYAQGIYHGQRRLMAYALGIYAVLGVAASALVVSNKAEAHSTAATALHSLLLVADIAMADDVWPLLFLTCVRAPTLAWLSQLS